VRLLCCLGGTLRSRSVYIISHSLRSPRAFEHRASSSSLGEIKVPGARHECRQLALGLVHFYDHVNQLSCQYSNRRVFPQARVKSHDQCQVVVWFAHAAGVPGDASLERLVEQSTLYTFLIVAKLCPQRVHLCPQPLPATTSSKFGWI